MNKETFSFVLMAVLIAMACILQNSVLWGIGFIIYGLHGAVELEYTDGTRKVEGISAAIIGILFMITGLTIIVISYFYGMNYMWHRLG